MLPASQNGEQADSKDPKAKSVDISELLSKLTKEQVAELDLYMGRIKSEYLSKIMDQVNIQNQEYFENLACEYTLQLEMIESGDPNAHSKITTPFGAETNTFLATAPNQEMTEEQLSYIEFMRKPEVIRMHLDILFKNILFLKKEKIDKMLNEYKLQKLQKQKEAEEQLQIQNQMRKMRGRSGQKKEKTKEDLAADFENQTPDKKKS